MDIYAIRKANLIALIGSRKKRECAEMWEMSPAHLSQVLSDKTQKNIGDDVARRVEDREGLPRGWLDTLRAEAELPKDDQPTNVEPGPAVKGRVPLISWVQAGDWCEAIDNFAPGDAEEWLPCPFEHSDTAFCLEVVGLSMSPDYREGEIIAIDPSVDAVHGNDVVCRTADGNVTFKRLQITPDGTYLLALNPDWPNRMIAIPEGTRICGVVIGSWMRRR